MIIGHNKGTELPTLRERLLAVESCTELMSDSVTTCWYRNPDGPEAAAMLQTAAEALEKCRDKFREYAQLHAAKLSDSLPDAEFNAILRKSLRNSEMADMCDATLERLNQ